MGLDSVKNHGTCLVDGCSRPAGILGRCKHHEQARVKRKTTTSKKGNNKTFLTEEDLKEIKKLYLGFKSKMAIARKYGVDATVINRVLSGEYIPTQEDSNG